MENEWFVGVDPGRRAVSKLTLDFALCHVKSPNQFIHHQFENCTPGFKKMIIWLKKHGVNTNNSLFCMEHTGHYTLALCCFLQDGNFPFTLVSPLHLKKSLGIIRGKNDKIDAKRISQFACLHHRILKPIQLPSACLLKLKNLMAFRDRLVKTNVSLKNVIKDLKNIIDLVDNSFIIKQSVAQHKLIEEQIKDTDKQIEATLKEDEEVQKHFNLIKSVVGIGMITAVSF